MKNGIIITRLALTLLVLGVERLLRARLGLGRCPEFNDIESVWSAEFEVGQGITCGYCMGRE